MAAQPNLLESPDVAMAVLAATPAVVVDANERLCEANGAFIELLGRPISQLLGLPVRKVMREAARDESTSTGEPTYRIHGATGDAWLRMQRRFAVQSRMQTASPRSRSQSRGVATSRAGRFSQYA